MSTLQTSEPGAAIRETLEKAEGLQKKLQGIARLLRSLKPEDLRQLEKGVGRLRGIDAPAELAADLARLADRLEGWLKQEHRTRPLRFGRALAEAAQAAGVEFASLTTDPPEYRLDPFTVAPDFARGRVELRYARLPLGHARLSPAEVLRARERLLAALEGKGFRAEGYFEKLREAYRRVLAATGRGDGERVGLSEILPELAFLMQPEKFRRDPTRDNYFPYGRVRLAYDLARLRRAGCLSHQGWRLSLGTATLGSTRRKDAVLFVEEGGGRGQYYMSLWFTR